MFRRRSANESTASPEGRASGTGSSAPDHPAGKGRPTPKRREAEAARVQRQRPPRDRKEAKQRMREERARERATTNEALRAGDERHYPLRDQGPARRLARNWIDGRRNVGEFFWPMVIAALLFLVLPVPQLQSASTTLLLTFYLFITVDTAVSLIGLRSLLNREAADTPDRKGAMTYAFGRSLQSRKRRLPVPQVEIGWTRRARKGDLTT